MHFISQITCQVDSNSWRYVTCYFNNFITCFRNNLCLMTYLYELFRGTGDDYEPLCAKFYQYWPSIYREIEEIPIPSLK